MHVAVAQDSWMSTKELAASEATMNIKYWPCFLPRPLSATAFSSALFAWRSLVLADMLTTIFQDPEDYPLAWSSFELTSRMRTNSEPSQEQCFQNFCLHVRIAHVVLYRKFTLLNFFVSLIFVVGWTNENILTPNFPQFMVCLGCVNYHPKLDPINKTLNMDHSHKISTKSKNDIIA